MASNKMDKGKCHGAGDVKAALRHNDISPERRAVARHGNPNIDLSKCGLNVNLTGDTYEERCAKYDARIAELDAQPGANKRKDRVTAQLIETPVPEGLPREKYNEFLRRVLDIQQAKYGAENLIAADIHWDEEHEYLDAETGETRMSRVHLQTVWVPVRDGRLYGQAIFNRAGMRQLNTECQRMAVREFKCNFMDGSGKANGKSVAELKAESAARAIKAEAERLQQIAEATVGKAQETAQEAQERLSAIEAREKAVAGREMAVKAAAGEIKQSADALAEKALQVGEMEKAVEAREKAVAAREKSAEKDRVEAARLLKRATVGYDAGFREWAAGRTFRNGSKTAEEFLDQWEAEYKAYLSAEIEGPKPKKRRGKVAAPAVRVEAQEPAPRPQERPQAKPPELDAAAQARIQATLTAMQQQQREQRRDDDGMGL